MNWIFTSLSAAYIFAIFFLADSETVSQIGEFNPYSLLHIPLYGLLTILLLLSLTPRGGKITGRRFWVAGLIGGIVGIIDEFHQTFIPARDGSMTDVLLDILGVLIALMIFRPLLPHLPKNLRAGTGGD